MTKITTKKKATILYVLKILQEASSKEHPISQLVIMRTINMIGISCDRRTIARDIDCLIEFGYQIIKLKGGGCYLINNDIQDDECQKIIDCILNSNLKIEEKILLVKKFRKITFYKKN